METYQRKTGFFGSVKKLGVTTVEGTNAVVTNTVNATVATTNVMVTATAVLDKATSIWGNDLLVDLENDAKINSIHRELDLLQQEHELTALKAQLEQAQANRPTGRPVTAEES